MGIGSGTAMLIGGLASAGGSVASGIMGSGAAKSAADAQAQAAERAAQLQYQESQNALDFQKQQWGTTQNELQPWLQSGAGALSNLNYLMGVTPQSPGGSFPTTAPTSAPNLQSGVPTASPTPTGNAFDRSGMTNRVTPTPLTASSNLRINPNPVGGSGMTPISGPGAPAPVFGASGPPAAATTGTGVANPTATGGFGSLMQPYGQTFQAPTALTEQNDPGYQARLNLGQQAMEQSAAARGGVLTGGNLQAENQLAQDYASNEYQNVYNRALNTFGTNYNVYNTNQANQFNRLAAMSGTGQTAANTLGGLGQETANAVSSNLLSTGQMMGNDYQNAGAANASGIMGSANAWSNGISGATGALSNLAMMQMIMGGGGGYGYTPSGNELSDMGV